jgi:SAM-dependent methyltransferase
MSTHEKKTFFATYDWAKSWQDLPWAHDEPTLFLAEICRRRGRPGRALDIGCGAGTDSVFLAQMGWDVTALDFMPKALEYTQRRAAEKGVTVTAVEADIAEWEPPAAYDLVLDHGLLHNMDPVRYPAYRACLMKALADGGDFVLLHWHPRFPGQGNGKMGPTRVDREAINAFFAPEFQERYFAREEFEDLPDMVGGGMTQAYYWFRRNQAHHRPRELLEQLRATLRRHSFDTEGVLARAGDGALEPALPAEHLARLVGPGRLGISHRVPAPADAAGVVADWARHAGVGPREALNLLTAFASPALGKVCVAGAPRCDHCDVAFCKRLRYR